MAGGRHGKGMGAAWARHAMYESALSSFVLLLSKPKTFKGSTPAVIRIFLLKAQYQLLLSWQH